MTRNVFILSALLLLITSFHTNISFATADSPVLQGLAGAGRGGLPKESLFTNPAGAAMLTTSSGFANYVKPSIPDFNAGGRGYSVGMYDGQAEWKGGFGYTRSSRAVLENSRQSYEDRSDLRFTMAHGLGASFLGGAQVRYVTVRNGATSTKFFQGDLGLIAPLTTDLRLGITYENVLQKPGERPGTVGIGTQYGLGFGITAFADGTRQMTGTRKGDRGWSLGAETALAAGFVARGGRFQDGYRRLKGWSVGLSWAGPRTSFDWAMRTTGTKNRERDHIFGMSIAL